MKNGSLKWRNDPCTTGSLETRISITSPLLNLLSGKPRSWAWGLNLDPRLNLPLRLSLIYRLKTSVVEFAFKLCLPISHRIMISNIRYARNSSSLKAFSETREKFWKRLRVRGYPFRFLLPLFREIRYSDRKRWLIQKPKHRSKVSKTIVFKTTFNCSHVRIKNVIHQMLPDLDCTVCYKSTVTLANLCK